MGSPDNDKEKSVSQCQFTHPSYRKKRRRKEKNEPKKQFDTQCKRQTFAIFIKLFMFLYVHIFPFKFLHRIIFFLFCVSSYINSNFLFFQLCLMCSVLLSFFPCCFFLLEYCWFWWWCFVKPLPLSLLMVSEEKQKKNFFFVSFNISMTGNEWKKRDVWVKCAFGCEWMIPSLHNQTKRVEKYFLNKIV